MSRPPRLLVMVGSSRQGSFNAALAGVVEQVARAAGAEVRRIDLRALQLPVFDGDIEAQSGVPARTLELVEAIHAVDGVVVVTPEYNGFPTPLFINAFDWLSRAPAQGDRPTGLQATASKPVAVLSASPGLLGGLRSLNFLRQYLQMAFAMLVVPQQFALVRASEAFDEQGGLKDPKARQSVELVVRSLLKLATALRPA